MAQMENNVATPSIRAAQFAGASFHVMAETTAIVVPTAATMATAHATLAVSYQLAPPEPDEMPTLDDAVDA